MNSQKEVIWQKELEPLLWLLMAAMVYSIPQVVPVFALSAVARLIWLGPEGAIAIFFSGQCLISLIFLSGPFQNIPLLGTTAILSVLLLIRFIFLQLKIIILLLLSATPLLFMAVVHNHGLSGADGNKFFLLIAQTTSSAVMIAYFLQVREIRLQQLATAFVLCAVGAAVLYFANTDQMFVRTGMLPIIDISRASGLATLVLIIYYETARSRFSKCIAALLAFTCLMIAAQTLTRQAIWAIPLALLCSTLFAPKKSFSRIVLLFLIIGCICVMILAFIPKGSLYIIERLMTFDGESETRYFHYLIAWKMFLDNPLFGQGFGGFGVNIGVPAYYPHNVLLDILCEFGLAGLAACSCIIVTTAHLVFRTSQAGQFNTVSSWVIAGIFLFWINVSLTSYALPHSVVCFFAIGWLGAQLHPSRNQRRS